MDIGKLIALATQANLPIALAHARSLVENITQAVKDGKIALETNDRKELERIHEEAMEAAHNLDRAAGQRAAEGEGEGALPGL